MENSSVIEQTVPAAQLLSLKFDLLSGEDIENFSNVNINDASDVTNAKLGLPSTSSECLTCGATNRRDCEGHFGVLKLPACIYHPYLLPEIVHILNKVCPGCKSIKKEMQKEVRRKKDISLFRRKLLKMKNLKLKLSHQTQSILFGAADADVKHWKGIKKKCVKVGSQTGCKYCTRKPGEWYPSLKFKISSNDKRGKKGKSITAEFNESLPRNFRNKSLSEVLPNDYWNFIPMYPDQLGTDLNKINLSPSQAFYLLRDFQKGFIEQFVPRRDLIFLSCLPVTPNCQRVVETSHADGLRLSFDVSTKAYRKAVDSGKKLNEFRHHQQFGALAASYVTNCVHDCLSASKLRSKQTSGEDHPSCSGLKWIKEVALSKRTDNTFRMVMVGDPKIEIGEIGVPQDIARTLHIAEHVNVYNVEKLKQSCRVHLLTKELHTRIKGKLTSLHRPDQLQVGSILYKPLENGDLVLANRNPSVHQHSLLGLSVKILPAKSVVSLNPLCCAPFLGDFDGDCLHGYIPQSVNARAELREIVSLDRQLLNGQDGRSLVSLTHDSLTAAHLLTKGEVFLNKFELQQLEMLCPFQSQYPAILKGPKLKRPYWTGHQLFSNLLPPNMDFEERGQVEIFKGEVVNSSGVSWLQNSTSGIFSWLFKVYGRKALNYLSSGQDVLCEYLTMRGLSVSISDIYLTYDPYTRKKMVQEVSCGLDHAKKSTYFNELLLEPEVGLLLKAYDENEDLSHSLNLSALEWERRPINPSSIAKFKDFFRELLNVIRHYISKDNAILSMVHAGSKGSLLKLVQQGVCLGLQLPSNSLHFSVPCRFSCSAWNQHKTSIKPDDTQDQLECCEGKNSCAIIESSLLDGLNPLECFFHALSGRSNLFSGNAEVSGTLTRKLMFYMRDIYLGYDGTVRNTYGEQIIQFSYCSAKASVEEGEHSRNFMAMSECNGGQPVGSLAACAVGEAAYLALDHPVNNFESSPLLNLKKALQCAPSRTSVNRTASVILSEKLRKLNYGFEYAALLVKNHLEKALFSDVVTSVMIFYAPDGVQGIKGVKLSPWISHFHVNKEIMIRKRLNLRYILDMLNEYYNYMREKFDAVLPKLCITIKNCLLDNQQKAFDREYCIAVAVEDSDSLLLLDTIRDSVIPILLDTHIKGFSEFKQVDILCDSRPGSRDLFLKVAMSEVCSPGKFWHTLQNACLPIMDLINWERSRPDAVHDISSSFGISCAWEYFVESLSSAISDIGRSIHPHHLLLVADRLSVSGEFHGLTAKGLKQGKGNLSMSSPFTQACFSKPENCFIEAAKQGLENHLSGTVDSVAWGKVAPVGTGGPFEVLYSGQVCDQISTENIYGALLSRKHDTRCQDLMQVDTKRTKRKSVVPTKDGRIGDCNDCIHISSREHSSIRCSESIPMPAGPWADIWDMVSSLREILNKYPINEHLNETDEYHVMEALQYHPRKDVKIGNGIKEIKIGFHPNHAASRCFIIVRNDGTAEDFSYRKCVIGAAKQISSDLGRLVEKELNRK